MDKMSVSGDVKIVSDEKICGIVMPISECDGCAESHCKEVIGIIGSATKDAGFSPRLVSEATDVGVIQKRIVQNLYDNEVVICDVSGKNPNVMFELGMRLAFDKPVIIVKDDITPYSFDTSPVEHLSYPRSLRYNLIVDFQIRLTEKIISAHNKGNEDSFLKSFGTFKVAMIDRKEASIDEIILEDLEKIKAFMSRISNYQAPRVRRGEHITYQDSNGFSYTIDAESLPNGEIILKTSAGLPASLAAAIKAIPGVLDLHNISSNDVLIDVDANEKKEVLDSLKKRISGFSAINNPI